MESVVLVMLVCIQVVAQQCGAHSGWVLTNCQACQEKGRHTSDVEPEACFLKSERLDIIGKPACAQCDGGRKLVDVNSEYISILENDIVHNYIVLNRTESRRLESAYYSLRHSSA